MCRDVFERRVPSADRELALVDLDGEARDRWIDRVRAEQRDSTVSTYYYRTELFVDFCEEEGPDSISDLTG